MPDFIGDTNSGDDIHGPSPDPVMGDPVSELMAQVAFEEQDVKDTLCEFFDWLAEKYQSDHWRLSERHARMMGRPATQLANVLWARLQAIMPDILGRWCETTPGALGFLTACGIVVAPKVMQQVKLSRERKVKKQSMVQPGASHGTVPVTPKRQGGMLYTEGAAE